MIATWEIRHGDALKRLREMPDESVHCVVTSPPYFRQRDYALGDAGIGQESTLTEHIGNLVAVMREVRRVLRDDGVLFLNYGDAYVGNPGNGRGGGSALDGGAPHLSGSNKAGVDLAPKQLMGLPWRVAFALQDDGWWLRSAIVWHKPSPMPESVRDRPTSAYEMIFLLAKSGAPTYWTHKHRAGSRTKPVQEYEDGVPLWRGHDYFYDAEAIRQPAKGDWHGGRFHRNGHERHHHEWRTVPPEEQTSTANARNVWAFPSKGLAEPHYAAFPPELPRRCILAGTSEHGVCADCGAPWARVTEKSATGRVRERATGGVGLIHSRESHGLKASDHGTFQEGVVVTTTGWQPTCDHDANVTPAVVLDPFSGSGTTGLVALQQGRSYVGIELNPEYVEMSRRRIRKAAPPMFSKEAS